MSEFVVELTPDPAIAVELVGECSSLVIGPEQQPGVELELEAILRGEKGDKGDLGNPGPPGPSGGDTYLHDQSVASTVWTINHFLGRFPAVTVVDSAGSQIEGDVRYVDANHVVVNFSYAFAGQAFLN